MTDAPKVPAIRAVLDVLMNWEKRIPPSLRDLCDASGVTSTSVLNFYIEHLVRLEYVEKIPRVARGVFYTGKPVNERDFIHEKGKRYAVISKAKKAQAGTEANPGLHTGRRPASERRSDPFPNHYRRLRQPTTG